MNFILYSSSGTGSWNLIVSGPRIEGMTEKKIIIKRKGKKAIMATDHQLIKG